MAIPTAPILEFSVKRCTSLDSKVYCQLQPSPVAELICPLERCSGGQPAQKEKRSKQCKTKDVAMEKKMGRRTGAWKKNTGNKKK